jgi:hypothetical protein
MNFFAICRFNFFGPGNPGMNFFAIINSNIKRKINTKKHFKIVIFFNIKFFRKIAYYLNDPITMYENITMSNLIGKKQKICANKKKNKFGMIGLI